jgi:hypothetical protein
MKDGSQYLPDLQAKFLNFRLVVYSVEKTENQKLPDFIRITIFSRMRHKSFVYASVTLSIETSGV